MKGLEIIVGALARMTPEERRGVYVRMVMHQRGLTFKEVGRLAPDKPLSKWLISDAVDGGRAWSPRIVLALENAMGVSLRAFLTPEEAGRLKAQRAK